MVDSQVRYTEQAVKKPWFTRHVPLPPTYPAPFPTLQSTPTNQTAPFSLLLLNITHILHTLPKILSIHSMTICPAPN